MITTADPQTSAVTTETTTHTKASHLAIGSAERCSAPVFSKDGSNGENRGKVDGDHEKSVFAGP
jgi:hypothetical protein